MHAFTNPEATELGKKFNVPVRYDAKVDKERKERRPSSLPPILKNKKRERGRIDPFEPRLSSTILKWSVHLGPTGLVRIENEN